MLLPFLVHVILLVILVTLHSSVQRNKGPGSHLSIASYIPWGELLLTSSLRDLTWVPWDGAEISHWIFLFLSLIYKKKIKYLLCSQGKVEFNIQSQSTEGSSLILVPVWWEQSPQKQSIDSEVGVEGLSAFASPCSRGLEDLATNEMQRNREKNKIIRQTVRQCDSFAEISDAKLLSSYLISMCFSGACSVFLCVFRK